MEHLGLARHEVIDGGLMGAIGRLEAIPGDYQHRAIAEGFVVQRYWHLAKLRLVDALVAPTPADVVLDVGCGSGVVADHLATSGARVTGIDRNPRAIEFASATFGRPNLTFALGLAEEVDLPADSLTWTVCMELLEHLDDAAVAKLLDSIHRCLRPGGRMLLTTPNYRGTWPLLEWALDRSGKAAHLEGDQHVNRFDRARLRRELSSSGFAVERLGTFCTFAPFAAPLGTRVADALLRGEMRVNLAFGNLLFAVARRS